jgi:hypothetical protein
MEFGSLLIDGDFFTLPNGKTTMNDFVRHISSILVESIYQYQRLLRPDVAVGLRARPSEVIEAARERFRLRNVRAL